MADPTGADIATSVGERQPARSTGDLPTTVGGGGPPDAGPDDSELELLRDVVGALSDPTMVLDHHGGVVVDNVAARELLGVMQLEGSSLRDLVADPDVVDDLLRRWRTTTASRPGVLTTVHGDRLRCDGGRLRARPLLLVHLRQQQRALQAFAHVTAQVDAANMRQLSQRLQKTIAELSAANRGLEAANNELEQYASAVSHDLRTPLFTIKGYLELLIADGMVTEEGMPLAEASMQAAKRLDRTISALLSVARLEPATRPSEPVDTRSVLDSVLQSLRADVDAADADVVVGSLPPLLVAEGPLAQVLQNLVANSLAHRSPDRPCRIEISARRLETMVEIAVRDNGTGIADGQHDRVFDLFHRGSTEQDGSGIGLTTCRKLVTRWGGEIRSVPVAVGAMLTFTAPMPSPQRGPSSGAEAASEHGGSHHVTL